MPPKLHEVCEAVCRSVSWSLTMFRLRPAAPRCRQPRPPRPKRSMSRPALSETNPPVTVVCAWVTETVWLVAAKSVTLAVSPKPVWARAPSLSPTPKSTPAKAEKLVLLDEAVLLSARLCCTMSREADSVTLGAYTVAPVSVRSPPVAFSTALFPASTMPPLACSAW